MRSSCSAARNVERLEVLLPRRAVDWMHARRARPAGGSRRRSRSPTCAGRPARSGGPGRRASWSGRPEKRWSSSRCSRFSARLPTCANAIASASSPRLSAWAWKLPLGYRPSGSSPSAVEEERAVGDRAQLARDLGVERGRAGRAPRRGPAGARGRRPAPGAGPTSRRRPRAARASVAWTALLPGVALERADAARSTAAASAPASAAVSAPASVAWSSTRAGARGQPGGQRGRERRAVDERDALLDARLVRRDAAARERLRGRDARAVLLAPRPRRPASGTGG